MGLSSIMGIVSTEHEVFVLRARGPIEVAMALNPSRMPHWGRFMTFSMWLQGYVPLLTEGLLTEQFSIVNPDSFLVFTVCTDVGLRRHYDETSPTHQEKEIGSSLHLYRPSCTRGVGRVASICPCVEVESSPSP